MGALEVELLHGVELFRGLTSEQLAVLGTTVQRRVFPAGTLLMTIEDAGDALFVIAQGSVKVYIHRPDGSEAIVAMVGVGQTVGEMAAFTHGHRSANVATMERSTLLWMTGVAFKECLRAMPVLSNNLNRLLCSRLRLANEQILALSSLDVAGRVAREILAYAELYGRCEDAGGVLIPLRLTQGDLAAIVGTSRERVNHVMVRFKQRGLLSVDATHHIKVHDRAALAASCR